MKTYTLEISEKPRIKGALNLVSEPVLEVDYQLSGYIAEIRVHSEYFGAFVPVTESWLENNFPSKLGTIYEAVRSEIAEQMIPAKKTYNNDDPNPAA